MRELFRTKRQNKRYRCFALQLYQYAFYDVLAKARGIDDSNKTQSLATKKYFGLV